jgi:hypothetical protein
VCRNTATGLPLIRKPFDAATLLENLHNTIAKSSAGDG